MKLPYIILLFFYTSIISAQFNGNKDSIITEIEKQITIPIIRNYQVNILQFGAKGDSATDNKQFFDKAVKMCSKKGGGTISVPKGIYKINGPIHFESNINLHLEEGAVLKFGSNPKDYPLVLTSWEGTFLYNYSPLIYAYKKKNISITGKGIIDGEASKTWLQWKPKEEKDKLLSREMNHKNTEIKKRVFGKNHFLRPQLLQFFDCEKIRIEGVRFEDSPFWTVHLLKSKNITIQNISFDAHNKNNDGIDIEYSSLILIDGVEFNNGDDNIAIKAGRDHEGRSNMNIPSENIIIKNCHFKGLHAVVIGSEMSAGVQNVFVENSKATGYLKRGIYFKTNSDRGSYIKNIHISNVDFGKVEDCIFMTSNYHGEGSGLFPSKIKDISISNISCENASNTGVVIEGFSESKVENILLDNITIKSAKNGITLTNTKNVVLNEVTIGDKAGTPSSVK